MQIQGIGAPGLAGVARRSTNALNRVNKSLRKVLHRLATAKRINRASDDAAGLAVAEQLTTQVRGFKMATRNVSDAISALDIADGAGTQIQEMIQRQRELAIQARNDTLTDEQRQMLDVEFQTLTVEIDRIAEGTEFNTQDVANGQGLATGTAQIQVGPNAGETVDLTAIDMTAANLGITGASIANGAAAGAAIGTLDNAMVSLNTQRSGIGAMVNRFESARNNLAVAEVNTTAAESVLRDQDMAMGLAELTRDRLLHESATTAFARYNEISGNHVLALLQ